MPFEQRFEVLMGRYKGDDKVEGVFAPADQLREYMENIAR
jgi:hypothetical protein